MSFIKGDMKKSQASLEYLVIVAIATFLLIPVIGLFFTTSAESTNTANSNLISVIGKNIVGESENVYYQGKNTKLRLSFHFPGNVKNVSIVSSHLLYELVFTSEFNGLLTDYVFYSHVNMTFSNQNDPCVGNVSAPSLLYDEGYKDVYVQSCGKYVAVYVYEG